MLSMDIAMSYKSFNLKAKNIGYTGIATNKKGVVSKGYKKFLEDRHGNAPIPDNYLYKLDTNRLLSLDGYVKNNGQIREKYKRLGYAYANQRLEKLPIKTVSNAIYTIQPSQFPIDGNWDFYKNLWKHILDSIPRTNNNITIQLVGNKSGLFNSWTGTLSPLGANYNTELLELFRVYRLGSLMNFFKNCGENDVDWLSYLEGLAEINPATGGSVWIGGENATNYFNEGGSVVVNNYIQLEPMYLHQQYLAGLDYNCVLNPICEYYHGLIKDAKSKGTKAKYQIVINKLEGTKYKDGSIKQLGYLKQYENGLYLEDIEEIVKDLPIDIRIFSPLSLYENKQLPVYEFKQTASKKTDKVFTYINSRTDHLDDIKSLNKTFEEATEKQLNDILDDHVKDGEFIPYTKNKNGCITSIYTDDTIYNLIDDSRDIIDKFENKNKLKNNCIYTNHRFNEFVVNAVHYNGCVDFVDMKPYQMAKTTQYHIDMEKAYWNFHLNPLYDKENAFVGRLSYYSNQISVEFALSHVGFYKIYMLNYDDVSINNKKILDKLSCYNDGMIYPSIDLKLIHLIGGKFQVEEGVYGLNMNIEFGEDMKRKFHNGQENNEIGVSLFSSWVGRQNSISKTKTLYVNHQSRKFLKGILFDAKRAGSKAKIYITGNSAKINFNKPVTNHRSHITAMILGYQRTSTLLQLFKLNYDDILRVVVDGIYYKLPCIDNQIIEPCLIKQDKKTIDDYFGKGKSVKPLEAKIEYQELRAEFNNERHPTLVSSFRPQFQHMKDNIAGDEYVSNYIDDGYTKMISDKKIPCEIPYKSKLILGAGGVGKTYMEIKRGNKSRMVYLGHSNKLATSVRKEYAEYSPSIFEYEPRETLICKPYQHLTVGSPDLENIIKRSADVVFADEASTMMPSTMRKIINACNREHIPVVVMGDLTHQNSPVPNPKFPEIYDLEKIYKLFDYIPPALTYNYRFRNCPKQQKITDKVRALMDKDIDKDDIIAYCKDKYGTIKKSDFIKTTRVDDLVLCATKDLCIYYNPILKKILQPKYCILKTRGTYNVGEVYLEKPELSPSCYEIRYAFTICSIQGETLEDNQYLYIDSGSLWNSRVLYTAISRAKYSKQIKFIVP